MGYTCLAEFVFLAKLQRVRYIMQKQVYNIFIVVIPKEGMADTNNQL